MAGRQGSGGSGALPLPPFVFLYGAAQRAGSSTSMSRNQTSVGRFAPWA
jgi:hypothetical protein